jgi:hypothetical protein
VTHAGPGGPARQRIGGGRRNHFTRYCSIAEERLQEFRRFIPLAETANRCAAGERLSPDYSRNTTNSMRKRNMQVVA